MTAAIDPFGLAGQVLDGQFRVDRFVGEGGFSIVYRGTHVGLSEPIAVKCLKLPQALGSAMVESFVRRFRDESRLHYKLSQGHLHIARSIASGTTVAPATSALVPYTVLEWLEGRSLAQDLDERRERGLGGRPLADAVKLLDSAVDALAYAHAQGVVHRDLNPGNLFLASTPSGVKLKVLDFGVAKVMADSWLAMGSAAKTLGNMRIFTPAFAAPEQFDERVGAVGPWTDVYAIALVFLEVLTGRTAMEGEHLGELAAMAVDPGKRPTPRALGAEVGDEVEAALARAVAVNPGERPRDAGEMWGMLKHAMAADAASGSLPAARPGASWTPPPQFAEAPAPWTGRHAFGGTLRMPNAPGSDPPRLAGAGLQAAAPEAQRAAPARMPAQINWAAEPIETPKLRAPVVLLVLAAVVAAGALALVWLLH
ncbi:MAG TPA: serine/threonine-protein kinase [Polyangiaceae bacterium]|nr:serine/threonine-protein kinase [Polyangiaceae bacterium]